MKDCTFKPKINQLQGELRKNNSVKRLDELHKIGKQYISGKKNKTRDEIEIEKNQQEYTFKPNLEKY